MGFLIQLWKCWAEQIVSSKIKIKEIFHRTKINEMTANQRTSNAVEKIGFEKVFELVGGHGKCQWILMWILSLQVRIFTLRLKIKAYKMYAFHTLHFLYKIWMCAFS